MYVRIGRYPEADETIERQIEVVIHRYDTWSMDSTLAYIIIPMLKQLKETKQGAPFVDMDDVPEHLRWSIEECVQWEKDGTTDKNFFHRWDWVMDEMLFAFKSKVDDDDWEAKYFGGETDRETVGIGDAQLRLFPNEDGSMVDYKYYEWKKGSNDTSWFDKEGYVEEASRIRNGFRLFGKYYEALWD
jgi:hypothetical protein